MKAVRDEQFLPRLLVPPEHWAIDVDERDARLRQRGMRLRHERFVVVYHLLRRVAVRNVVVTRVTDDGSRLVADDEEIDVIDGIGNLGAAEPTIQAVAALRS